METDQMKVWKGEFGAIYTDRNKYQNESMDELYMKDFGITRTEMNRRFLGKLDRSMKILEIGPNSGNQLIELSKMGFRNLSAVELNPHAIEVAKKAVPSANIVQGNIFKIPFPDRSFDMVFTSRVLIHISPKDIQRALKEICRVAKEYIWGFEYFTPECTEVNYRGHENLLWKTDFAGEYLQIFPGLEMVKREKLKYLYDDNVDEMFLLRKK